MQKTLQIGLTGGIGSGKSLVSKIFACLGAPVYDADSRAKYLMTTDGILMSGIKKEFGELSFSSEGVLNRAHISEVVFKDAAKLQTLNSLVHPRVAEDYRQWVESHDAKPYVIKEAALLFEAKSYRELDKIIVVDAPESLRIRRVTKRDGRSEQQVRDIISKQLPDALKLQQADFIVKNDESVLVIPQVLALHKKFCGE
ncbi:MAG: dephospho-CoA kinase [Bacteroidia bacterium]|nr:dephospho-CoA kinase [Bacteroidia bacterium]